MLIKRSDTTDVEFDKKICQLKKGDIVYANLKYTKNNNFDNITTAYSTIAVNMFSGIIYVRNKDESDIWAIYIRNIIAIDFANVKPEIKSFIIDLLEEAVEFDNFTDNYFKGVYNSKKLRLRGDFPILVIHYIGTTQFDITPINKFEQIKLHSENISKAISYKDAKDQNFFLTLAAKEWEPKGGDYCVGGSGEIFEVNTEDDFRLFGIERATEERTQILLDNLKVYLKILAFVDDFEPENGGKFSKEKYFYNVYYYGDKYIINDDKSPDIAAISMSKECAKALCKKLNNNEIIV